VKATRSHEEARVFNRWKTLFAALVLASSPMAASHAQDKPAAPPAAAGASQYREFVLGDPKATVTVIEYASLTCSHCAHFHKDIYPELKKAYIDTGKIKFVFRDFPLDGLAMAGAVLARCAPGDRGSKLIDMMFKNQDTWIRSEKPLEPLKGYAQLAGMSAADVDACLANQDMQKTVRDIQNTASSLYKVQSTPTFFIEDEKIEGAQPFEKFKEIIDDKIDEKS
jgi:protein-disulfide isomerase